MPSPAAGSDQADAVYTNARVYTVDEGNSWAEALAVRDGKLLAVGTTEEILSLAGDDTEVNDLGGRMLMPGIHDTHVHPVDAGMQSQFECSFRSNDLALVLERLRKCVAETPAGEWVRGGQWNESLLPANVAPKAVLDEVAPDHPVFLMDWSVHNAWVNSRALERLEIGPETPDPPGGIILRDAESGEPTGILLDNAAYNARRRLPAYSRDQIMTGLSWSIRRLAEHGVTTIKDAMSTTPTVEAYVELDRRDSLPIRVNASLSWKSAWARSHADELDLIARRRSLTGRHLATGFAKIMLDGVPPTYTAALLEPYEPNELHPADYRGELMLPPDELIEDVVRLDRQGLSVKIHATGDRSVRSALDAFAAARAANGDSGRIHEVSHAALIHPDDVPRFSELNVAAEMCPILWYPIPGLDWEAWFGKRGPIWPVRNLVESGALVIYGSDWPVVPTPNPWPGIEAMVTRRDPHDQTPGATWPDQAVDLETVIRIFTINGATANAVRDSSGSLEPGKDADFIVLDRNIFEVPIEAVGETRVLLTVVGGRKIVDAR
ncbi:MAG TPA: amidohydrolase [Woeseiaceae bacterium]|nr:amidohydrolase [Woeseiaceae bacterium]